MSVKTEVISTETPTLFANAVSRAAALLLAGEAVALPTETVYGLAANAFDAAAVARIFEIKGRPINNPLIVHIANLEMARGCAAEWPAAADDLARSFWPGPLTMVLRKGVSIADLVTAGGKTVGLRWPSHPFMQAVIRECGFPLAAPSANLSNRVSPTNAAHVQKALNGRVKLIVDGGQSQVGIESTVLDLSVRPPRILRPGMLHEQSLAAVLGELALGELHDGSVLKSPGQLPKHYAPKGRLMIASWSDDDALKAFCARHGGKPEKTNVIVHTRIPAPEGWARVSVIPHDAEAFGRSIYGELHACDDSGAELIIVEAPPEGAAWRAITDRLRRAAA